MSKHTVKSMRDSLRAFKLKQGCREIKLSQNRAALVKLMKKYQKIDVPSKGKGRKSPPPVPPDVRKLTFSQKPLTFNEIQRTSARLNQGTIWGQGASFSSDDLDVSRLMHQKNATTIQVRLGRTLAGYMLYLRKSNHTYLERLFLTPRTRGKRIGSYLMKLMLHNTRGEIRLHTGKASHRAINFYKRYGFRVQKTLKGFYGKHDAVLMVHK